MKNHWFLKFLAFLLAVFSGILLVFSAAGIILSEETGFVENRRNLYSDSEVYEATELAADFVAGRYAQKCSGMSEEFFREYIFWDYPNAGDLDFEFDYRLMDNYNRTLENTRGSSSDYYFEYNTGTYIVESKSVAMPEMTYYPEDSEFFDYVEEYGMDAYGTGVYLDDNGVAFPALTDGTYAYAYGYEDGQLYRIDYIGTHRFQVEICLTVEQYAALIPARDETVGPVALLFRQFSFKTYFVLLGVSLILMALAIVWLCVMAGKAPGSEELRPGGLNRLPLDLYTVAAVTALVMLVVVPAEFMSFSINLDADQIWLWMSAMAADGAAFGLVAAMFAMALAAQWKMGGGYWWRHTLTGMAVCWCAKGGKRIKRFLGRGGAACKAFFRALPVIWQWILAVGAAAFIILITFYAALARNSYLRLNFFFTILLILEAALCVCVVWYCVYAFGILKKGVADMSQGDLNQMVPVEHLRGPFRTFARDLNTLGDVCVDAAKKQMRSERMKTELITNVSHDIKTPLTSIINYVDLLQHCSTEEERRNYLEVLSRQSHQLKKLIEDLMEMSKASSGNISTEIVPTDVTEAVKQALGEFSDRLDQKDLTVLYRAAEEPLMAKCDGKLLWRVLSNLLTNVVKYALPGTRVYVDLARRENRVECSLKNISAEPLNISADELAERFVRGDASRNTEGNGLGLNIARSLMEVQGGTLELVVDGDLFKVVLSLPACS